MAAANRVTFEELQSAAFRIDFEHRDRVVVARGGVEESSTGVNINLGGRAENLRVFFRQRFNGLDLFQCSSSRVKAKRCHRNLHLIDDISESTVRMKHEMPRSAGGRAVAGTMRL